MGGNVKIFTADGWDADVLKSESLVLVDFWATWCAPCRMIAPTVEALADKYSGKLVVGKLNVDEHPGISGQYGIRGIPTLLLFKNGKIAEQVVGVQSKEQLAKLIDKHV